MGFNTPLTLIEADGEILAVSFDEQHVIIFTALKFGEKIEPTILFNSHFGVLTGLFYSNALKSAVK